MDFVEDLLVNGTTKTVTIGELTLQVSREAFVAALFTLLALGVFVAFVCRSRSESSENEKSGAETDLNETLLQSASSSSSSSSSSSRSGSTDDDDEGVVGTGGGEVVVTPAKAPVLASAFDRSPSYKYDDRYDEGDDDQGEGERGERGEGEQVVAQAAATPTTPKRRPRRPKRAAPSTSETQTPLRRSARKRTPRKFYSSY